jgi:transcriptional regulator with XRE-family HTH domain
MVMESFLAELRRAREEKGISLAEISAATFISEKMLEAVEQGNFTVLPQAYVRAFIREYALVVGLNADEVLRKYDAARSAGEPQLAAPDHTEPPTPVPEPVSTPVPQRTPGTLLTPSRLWKFIGIVAAVIIIELVVWQLMKIGNSGGVEEIPFQSVVEENEQRLLPDSLAGIRADPLSASRHGALPGGRDSITLVGLATDSVWLRVVLDTLETREFLLAKGGRITLKARKRFLVTLGNAGGMEFTVNGRPIGKLGRRLAVVRNVPLDAHSQRADSLKSF